MKSLFLNKSKYSSNKITSCNTDFSHTSKRDLDVIEFIVRHDLNHSVNNASDSLRFAHSSLHAYFVSSQENVEIKKIKDYKAFYFIYSLINYLNYR
jgi:hypothetical protein